MVRLLVDSALVLEWKWCFDFLLERGFIGYFAETKNLFHYCVAVVVANVWFVEGFQNVGVYFLV